jgi:hypothetical protein
MKNIGGSSKVDNYDGRKDDSKKEKYSKILPRLRQKSKKFDEKEKQRPKNK